jgi:hypothetical protein
VQLHRVIFASFGDYVAARFGADEARALLDGESRHLMSDAYPDERLARSGISHPNGEAWEVTGPDTVKFVCMPDGGEPAIWT